MTDQDYLQLATEEGKKGTAPHLYGAVVVKDGEILAVDHNHVWETKDPSAHAEVSAIKQACLKVGSHNIDGATLYASHEPCIMCFCCAAWANFERIVFAVPASEQTSDSYEFSGVSIYDMAERLQKKIVIEQVKLDEEE